MKKTVSAGGVVVNSKGQVLVVSQNGDSWSLPKGHLDSGENAFEAARREILEEAGLRSLQLVRELGSYDRYRIGLNGLDDRSELKTIVMFLFRTAEQALKPLDPENPEARWVPVDQVSALLTHLKDKEFFNKIKNQL